MENIINDNSRPGEIKKLETNDPIFDDINLTFEQQTYVRGKPIKYLQYTIDMFNKYTNKNVIVEVGSIRSIMNHTIDQFNPVCCNDGHSTYFWKHYTTADIYTVDINPNSKMIISSEQRLNGVNAYTQDAKEFLKTFDRPIDLLFLDAWDVEPGKPYAEDHLDAYNICKNKLSKRCLILIDDTDVGKGGKGKLLIPKLIEDGFTCLANGRQTLFMR